MSDTMTDSQASSNEHIQQMISKTKAVAIFINQVGIPSLIVIVFVGLIAGTWMGKIPSPVVTSAAFEDHVRRSDERHDAIVRNSDAQVEVLRETKTVLKGISCDLKPTDKERILCFKEMNAPN